MDPGKEIYNGFSQKQHDLYMAIISRDYCRCHCQHLANSTECQYCRCYDVDGSMREEATKSDDSKDHSEDDSDDDDDDNDEEYVIFPIVIFPHVSSIWIQRGCVYPNCKPHRNGGNWANWRFQRLYSLGLKQRIFFSHFVLYKAFFYQQRN